jgi:hypothetical protein
MQPGGLLIFSVGGGEGGSWRVGMGMVAVAVAVGVKCCVMGTGDWGVGGEEGRKEGSPGLLGGGW